MGWKENNQSAADGDTEDRFNEEVSKNSTHVEKVLNVIVAEVQMQAATERAQGGK